MRISDWSSDVCSSDLRQTERGQPGSADDRSQPRDLRDELLWRDPGLPDLCARDRRKRRRRGYQRTVGCRLALAPPARGLRSLEGGALELYQCPSQRFAGPEYPEIGRALGRERGGQYVEYPGVAG